MISGMAGTGKRGRPSLGTRKEMNWRSPSDIRSYADQMARDEGISTNEWLTRLVQAHRATQTPPTQGHLFDGGALKEYRTAS